MSVKKIDANIHSCNDMKNDSTLSSETAIADETMYICKQLVASLKRISDNTDANVASDELGKTEINDNTAKQYIADQIAVLMQTVNASQSNSPLVSRFSPFKVCGSNMDTVSNHEYSDSDSPLPNECRRCFLKNKTPSESGSETTISASISIPSYDDSDRTPTESEISHEMDELYALLESNGTETSSLSKVSLESCDTQGGSLNCDTESTVTTRSLECSLLFGAASKLESLLPISVEERIAMYTSAFINKEKSDMRDRQSEMRINVMLPLDTDSHVCARTSVCSSPPLHATVPLEVPDHVPEKLPSIAKSNNEIDNVTSVKIRPCTSVVSGEAAMNSIPLTEILFTVNSQPNIYPDSIQSIGGDGAKCPVSSFSSLQRETVTYDIISPLPKIINPKEKASSENDLLVANYRAKSKNKVFGTKSTGNISELENMNGKNAFRDTGYYSFKSSAESFLSLDDSTNSRTSTTSLTHYRSLTSTETIPEEEEASCKGSSPTKISLSSGNIPYEVCDTPTSKSSTLPPSLRGKLSGVHTGSHRSRSSFFSTSGVLRKLALLRDESGNSLRSSPHGRMRVRHRTLSGGSEDGKQSRESVPQFPVSACTQKKQENLQYLNFEREGQHYQDEETEQVLSYHSRSQMSLSSFGGRSGSVTSIYSAAGGGRYGTVNVTGEVCFSMNYSVETGTFELLIKACRNLAPVDSRRGRSDPYVKVYLLPDRTKSGKRKTKVKKHTLNPVFEELLRFQVKENELERRTLWLSVWHSDRFGRNDFLGEIMLPVCDFKKLELKWYSLQEKLETLDTPVSYSGDLILALKYVPSDMTTNKNQNKQGNNQKNGALHVLIKEARNLMATRTSGTSDPFCKSYLLPDKSKSSKQKTPVLKKTCNPKWNHTFLYENVTLDELRSRCLELTLWDYDKITSNDFLGGVRLCLGTGSYMEHEVDWMDSAGEEVSLWYTMLDRPNMWVDGSLLLRSTMQNRNK